MILDKYKDLAVPDGVELKELPGYEGKYSVGSDGQIYSHFLNARRPSPYRMKPKMGSKGYLYIGLKQDNQCFQRSIHVWTCLAFYGPKPTPLHEVRHLDGNKLNNKPENLCWGTRLENAQDRKIHGTSLEGSGIGIAKFSDEEIRNMRYLYENKEIKPMQLARLYKVCKMTIYKILLRRTYKNA